MDARAFGCGGHALVALCTTKQMDRKGSESTCTNPAEEFVGERDCLLSCTGGRTLKRFPSSSRKKDMLEQELVWSRPKGQPMRDSKQRRNNGFGKKSSKNPDFEPKRMKGALRAGAELVLKTPARSHFNDGSDLHRHSGAPGQEYFLVDESSAEYIQTLCKQGRLKEALHIFHLMEQQGIKACSDVYACLLQACISMKSLTEGKWIHTHIIKSGFQLNVFLENTLVNMYAKLGCMMDARAIFDKMPERNVFTWTIMIGAYAKHGRADEAFKLFQQMEQEGVKPNDVTFVNIVKACASLRALKDGKRIHSHIIKTGFESDVFVGSALVDMYTKCGSVQLARRVFDKMPNRNVVSWTAMITGYAQHGPAEEAIQLFRQMQCEGVQPDVVTFVSILKACASLVLLDQGKQIHAHIIRGGFDSGVFVGNALVDMYAKCGSIRQAREVFDKMYKHDVISWNVMIAGYVQLGHAEKAFELFRQMEWQGMKPNEVTFLSLLKACSSIISLEWSKQIHAYIIRSGFESDVVLGNSLVDTYAKCGGIEQARQVFNQMNKRDVVSWNSMIAGYAQHGDGKEALQLVEQMQREGVKLDHITFVGVLSACSHTGLVDEGRNYFESMRQNHGITPTSEHCVCMVDLLGRAGFLEEAEEFIEQMPFLT